MVIEIDEVKDYVETLHYNMEVFEEYLRYQEENRDLYLGKWTIEEYGATRSRANDPVDIEDPQFQEWFGRFMGFGTAADIPDFCSFERYCLNRNLEYLDIYKKTPLKGYMVVSMSDHLHKKSGIC